MGQGVSSINVQAESEGRFREHRALFRMVYGYNSDGKLPLGN